MLNIHTKQYTKIANYILVVCSLFVSNLSQAQCAMCRASLESSGDHSQAEALNDGIVYLMVIPYVLVAVVGYVVYKMFVKKKNSNL